MALFESGNPTLSEKYFQRSNEIDLNGTMTVRGSINKFGFLMLMVIAGAAYTWHLYSQYKDGQMMTLFWVGLIGSLILGLVISFRPRLAQYLAPVYGLLEGLMLGTFSVLVNEMAIKKGWPGGVVPQAVGLTFGVAIVMFLLYNFRIIKPTEKFKSVMISAILGVGLLYLAYWILGIFHINLPFMNWGDSSALGIGINIVVLVIAALTLILDFERIEVGSQTGAPKYMEWYCAFGLLVTMVWLYIQILKLLSRFANSRN